MSCNVFGGMLNLALSIYIACDKNVAQGIHFLAVYDL